MTFNNRNRRVPFDHPIYQRGTGTNANEIDGRDHTSAPAYTVNERRAGYPFKKLAIPELWWEPYNTPRVSPKVSLEAVYGRVGRPGRPAIGQGTVKIIVHQNPTAPVQPTARGFESMDKALRVGTFQAGMNIAATARRRRGQ